MNGEEQNALFARLDERTEGIARELSALRSDLTGQQRHVSQNYVRRDEFRPVKALVYGFVSVTMVAVVGSLLALVFVPAAL